MSSIVCQHCYSRTEFITKGVGGVPDRERLSKDRATLEFSRGVLIVSIKTLPSNFLLAWDKTVIDISEFEA